MQDIYVCLCDFMRRGCYRSRVRMNAVLVPSVLSHAPAVGYLTFSLIHHTSAERR